MKIGFTSNLRQCQLNHMLILASILTTLNAIQSMSEYLLMPTIKTTRPLPVSYPRPIAWELHLSSSIPLTPGAIDSLFPRASIARSESAQ